MRTRPAAPAVTARGGEERGERPRREACAGREAAGPRMRPAGPARASLWAPLGSFPARLGTARGAGDAGTPGGGDGRGGAEMGRGRRVGLGVPPNRMGRGRRFSPPVSHGGDRWASAAAGSMGYRFLVTVRIRRRRADRPPRVRAFVVQFPRSSRHRSASRARAVVALLLMLARSQRGPRLHPGAGRRGPPKPRRARAVVPRAFMHLPQEVEKEDVPRADKTGEGRGRFFHFG